MGILKTHAEIENYIYFVEGKTFFKTPDHTFQIVHMDEQSETVLRRFIHTWPFSPINAIPGLLTRCDECYMVGKTFDKCEHCKSQSRRLNLISDPYKLQEEDIEGEDA